jgi:hypothetical protein
MAVMGIGVAALIIGLSIIGAVRPRPATAHKATPGAKPKP